jgi:hypothetical protein
MKQADRHRTCEPTDRTAQHDQFPVMFGDEAIEKLDTLQTPAIGAVPKAPMVDLG